MAGRPTNTRRSTSARGDTTPGHSVAGSSSRPGRGRSAAERRSATTPGRFGTLTPPKLPGVGARGISRRGVTLVVLLLAVALVLAPFVRAWVEQQGRIEALRSDIAARQQAVDDLKVAKARWDDDQYVITQARKRFTFVMPGEVGYVVLDTPRTVADKQNPSGAAAREAAAAKGSWVGRLWSSVEVAGASAADPAGSDDK